MEKKDDALRREFIIDEEIDLFEKQAEDDNQKKDLLNTSTYVNTLTSCVLNAPEDKSFTIGLFGEWGSGKSSIIKTFCKDVVSKYAKKNQKVKIITYDAWKYSNDSFRRMFLLRMQKELGLEGKELFNSFYLNTSEDAHIETKFSWRELVIGAVVFLLVCIGIVKYTDFSIDGKILATAIVSLCTLGYSIIRGLFREVKVNIQRPHLFAPEQFEACFNEMCDKALSNDSVVSSYLKYIKGESGENGLCRLIIVIDNIDRCSSELAYELLTNIKNFLGQKHNTIFIIPVDEDALKKHILKNNPSAGHEAEEFLRKFFNTSIWMKPFQNDEMFDFADDLAKHHELGFYPDTISLVANEFATNPRRIIQLFNNLQIELNGYPADFAKEHQALICKLLIIREEFSKFYHLLLSDPKLFYVDVVDLKNRQESDKTSVDKSIIADTRLSDFLLASSGISTRYVNREDVVISILVNSQMKSNITEKIRQAYRSADKDTLLNYAKEPKNLNLLINYLQDNIKKMAKRQTIEAEGKTHLSVLLILFENNLLTAFDKYRLLSPLDSNQTLYKCVNLFADKESLIKFAKDLESIRLPKLSSTLIHYFKTKDNLVDTLSQLDVLNIFYAASIWDLERCKTIAPQFVTAYQQNPSGCRKYNYSADKFETLFTKDIYNHLLNQLEVDKSEDENSSVQSFKHLCHIRVVDKDNLRTFIKKANEKAVSYDYKNPDNETVTKYLKALSDIFAEARYLGRCVPLTDMNSLFDKINGAQSVTINQGYNRTITTNYSYVNDKASDQYCAEVFINFFSNANLISDGPIVSNAEIERFTEFEANRDKVLETLMYLKGQGIDVSAWTDVVIRDQRRTDIKRIEILKDTFTHKAKDGTYEVKNVIVKNEITEFINLIQSHADGYEQLVEMFDSLLSDERIDMIVREILSGKTLEEQKRLPLSLMKRAIASFEQNIAQLNIDKDINVCQLIASNGSSEGIEGVWEIINPILADGKNRQPQTINHAIQVLQAISKMTNEQAEALAGNVKALPSNKLSEEKKEEVLKYIKEHKQ